MTDRVTNNLTNRAPTASASSSSTSSASSSSTSPSMTYQAPEKRRSHFSRSSVSSADSQNISRVKLFLANRLQINVENYCSIATLLKRFDKITDIYSTLTSLRSQYPEFKELTVKDVLDFKECLENLGLQIWLSACDIHNKSLQKTPLSYTDKEISVSDIADLLKKALIWKKNIEMDSQEQAKVSDNSH